LSSSSSRARRTVRKQTFQTFAQLPMPRRGNAHPYRFELRHTH
jgi:hypothetical protein